MGRDRSSETAGIEVPVPTWPAELVVPEQPGTSSADAFAELERGVHAALETYSNVHRGTGHHSIVSTALYEQARDIVLRTLDLDADRYAVVFCTPWRCEALRAQLEPGTYHVLSSTDLGLPLGQRALAVDKQAAPRGVPYQTGGDTVELVARRYVVWADPPHRYEAGTPNIVSAIALAKALTVLRNLGRDSFAEADAGSPGRAPAAVAAEILHHDALPGVSGPELLVELRKALVGRGLCVPTAEGERRYINLDHGASTPTFTPIWDAVRHTWRQPEAVRREIVRQVREICARFLGAPQGEYEIVYTCNTTEALNIVAQSLRGEPRGDTEPVVLNTWMEHHSNELPWRYVPGLSLVRLPVDKGGFIDLDELERLLREYNKEHRRGRKRIQVVAVSGASNVLGSFNDLGAISRLAHWYGARLLVDGAQLVAHRKTEMAKHEIDYLALSGHKMYAPFGSGALVVRRGLLRFDPREWDTIRASGEENVAGIAALGKAMLLLGRVGMDVIEDEERALTWRALRGLSAIPGVKLYGVRDPDSPRFQDRGGIIVFELASVPRNAVAQELCERGGIGVRDGCFCAHFISRELMGIHPIRTFIGAVGLKVAPEFFRTVLPGLVRVSLGLENEERDVDTLIHVLTEITNAPRSCSERITAFTHNGTPLLPHTEAGEQITRYAAMRASQVYSYAQD